ncbi:MAG: hypothetical protein ACP5KF_00310 [Sulfurihydrogenibium sp.]
MAEIILYDRVKIIPDEGLESYVIQIYENLKSINTIRHKAVIDYLAELNGNSSIPDPDTTTGNWRSNLKSSIFFQKTIFAYLYLRSLIQKSTQNLLQFDSPTYTYLPSAYKKIFDYAIHKTRYFDAIDKALYYAILSSVYAIKIEAQYNVDEWEDVELNIVCEPIHPLNFYYSADKSAYAIDSYTPVEKVFKLREFWNKKNVEIKPYLSQDNEDRTYYKVSHLSQKPYAKITTIYARYIDEDSVSIPYKFVLLNDKDLVDYEPLSYADRRFPIIHTSFYSEDMQMSYADLLWEYYKEDSRFLRAILDRALLSTASGFEINVAALDNQAKEFTVKPFTIITTMSEQPAVRPFSLASFDPNVLPVRQLILQEAQNVSALTEFLMGLPTSKGRPTAKEVALKTQMNQQIISTIIYRLENEFIKQTAQKLISLFLQYKFEEVLELLNENERREFNLFINKAVAEGREPYYYLIKELYKGLNIRVEGVSGVVKAKEEVENIMQFIEMAANMGLTPYLDVAKAFEILFKKLEIPSDIVRIPTPEELQAMAQQQAVKSKISTQELARISQEILSNPDVLEKLANNPEALAQYIDAIANMKLQQLQEQQGEDNGDS